MVTDDPGHTRYYYIRRSSLGSYRMSWAYRPFDAMIAQGKIVMDADGNLWPIGQCPPSTPRA